MPSRQLVFAQSASATPLKDSHKQAVADTLASISKVVLVESVGSHGKRVKASSTWKLETTKSKGTIGRNLGGLCLADFESSAKSNNESRQSGEQF